MEMFRIIRKDNYIIIKIFKNFSWEDFGKLETMLEKFSDIELVKLDMSEIEWADDVHCALMTRCQIGHTYKILCKSEYLAQCIDILGLAEYLERANE